MTIHYKTSKGQRKEITKVVKTTKERQKFIDEITSSGYKIQRFS